MAANQAHVLVYALVPGHLYLAHKEVFQDALESNAETGDVVPTFSFLIEHPTRGKHLFDLGLRKHAKGYPPVLQDGLAEMKPECDQDAADILSQSNIDPKDVKGIIFSHLHFDHIGDVERFPSAEITLGGEAEGLFAKLKTYPEDPESELYAWPEGRTVRYIKFDSSPAKVLSAKSTFFNKSYDYFGDGSLLLIEAPGHFPGHLAALARVGTATNANDANTDETFVLLAGDCCHNRQCYTVRPSPELRVVREISEINHEDIEQARATMSLLIRIAEDISNVVIILAHEKELESKEEGMPLLPMPLNAWAKERVLQRKLL